MRTRKSWQSLQNPVTTGSDGRYKITNVPQLEEYRVEFVSAASLHFNKELKIKDPGGFKPIELSVTLPRGITVRG